MSVVVVSHPLAEHLLASLRDRTTPPPVFRTLAKRLALALALEAIRDLPTTQVAVETPLEHTTGRVLGDLVPELGTLFMRPEEHVRKIVDVGVVLALDLQHQLDHVFTSLLLRRVESMMRRKRIECVDLF